MKRLIGFALLLAVFALTSDGAPAQNLKTDIFPATPQAYALLAQYKEIIGTIENNTGSAITLRVKYDHAVVTPGGNTSTPRNNSNNRSRGRTNPIQQLQAIQRAQLQKLQQIRANTKIDHDFIDFELPLSDKVTVRRAGSGVEFDSSGFPKETAAGEKGMIGVAAKVDELKAGSQVKVYLGPIASASPAKKDANGAIVTPANPGGRPVVRMAVILENNSLTPPPKKK